MNSPLLGGVGNPPLPRGNPAGFGFGEGTPIPGDGEGESPNARGPLLSIMPLRSYGTTALTTSTFGGSDPTVAAPIRKVR